MRHGKCHKHSKALPELPSEDLQEVQLRGDEEGFSGMRLGFREGVLDFGRSDKGVDLLDRTQLRPFGLASRGPIQTDTSDPHCSTDVLTGYQDLGRSVDRMGRSILQRVAPSEMPADPLAAPFQEGYSP